MAEYNENGEWLAAAVRTTIFDRAVDLEPFQYQEFGNQKKCKIPTTL
jgi:hypothetical protein